METRIKAEVETRLETKLQAVISAFESRNKERDKEMQQIQQQIDLLIVSSAQAPINMEIGEKTTRMTPESSITSSSS
jgi:hypothetical protein